MKIALIGYGKMGQMVEKRALIRGHSIVARFSSDDWEISPLQEADICIEFTNPHSVIENIQRLAELKKNIIIGTTGWYDKMHEVSSIIERNQIGALYAPNFSIGVHF